MSHNSFGHLFRITTWGESHGPAIGCVVDGCPPRLPLSEADIQPWLDKRRPGQSRFTTQRQEPDEVRILSGVFEGVTTGTPIALEITNMDQRSRDYGDIAERFRPGHADLAYELKYGVRDYRGGGRSSARETAMRVAAGAIARRVLGDGVQIRAALVQMGPHRVERAHWDWDEVNRNPFFCPDAEAAAAWAEVLTDVRKAGSSLGAVVEVVAEGVPPGLGAPIYAKLDADLAAALMGINAVKGVEIGDGFAAASLRGEENADEMWAEDGRVRFGLQPRWRYPGRDQHGAGGRRPLCRQADQFDPAAAPQPRPPRRAGRGRDAWTARPLRWHPRRAGRGSDGGLRAGGSPAAPPRPEPGRARRSPAAAELTG